MRYVIPRGIVSAAGDGPVRAEMAMRLEKWNPFEEMDGMLSRFRGVRSLRRAGSMADWTPAVDIQENNKEYVLTAELPGLKKEDIAVDVLGGVLTLSGERGVDAADQEIKNQHIERPYGAFCRSFVLPEGIAIDKIAAEHKDGVLYVHIPKGQFKEDRSTRITIQ